MITFLQHWELCNRQYGVSNRNYKWIPPWGCLASRDSGHIMETLCNLTAGLDLYLSLYSNHNVPELKGSIRSLNLKIGFEWRPGLNDPLFYFFPHKCKWAFYRSHGKCTILEFTENVYLKYLNNLVCRVGLSSQNKQPPIW